MENFNYDEILADLNTTTNYPLEEKKELARAIARNQYELFNTERKNFSFEAEKIMESIKNGHIPTQEEVFVLVNEEEYIEKHRENLNKQIVFNEIRERVADGHISEEDFNYLVNIVGFDADMTDLIRQSFFDKGILIPEYDDEIKINK